MLTKYREVVEGYKDIETGFYSYDSLNDDLKSEPKKHFLFGDALGIYLIRLK